MGQIFFLTCDSAKIVADYLQRLSIDDINCSGIHYIDFVVVPWALDYSSTLVSLWNFHIRSELVTKQTIERWKTPLMYLGRTWCSGQQSPSYHPCRSWFMDWDMYLLPFTCIPHWVLYGHSHVGCKLLYDCYFLHLYSHIVHIEQLISNIIITNSNISEVRTKSLSHSFTNFMFPFLPSVTFS